MFRGDFNCALCSFKPNDQNSNTTVIRYIFCSFLANRSNDSLQSFSRLSEADQEYSNTIRRPIYLSEIRKKLSGTEAPYAHVENFLNDLRTFFGNILKFSDQRGFTDAAENAKNIIADLIRKSKPTIMHYWMQLMMRPESPLVNKHKKRVLTPKTADSEDESTESDKKPKIEVTSS